MHGTLRLPETPFADAAPVEVLAPAVGGPLRRLLERLRGVARRPAALTTVRLDAELLEFRRAEVEARVGFDEAMEAWAGRD